MDIVCSLVDPFNQQRNQSHLAPSIKRKIDVVLDMMQLPNPAAAPPNRADVGNFQSNQQIIIRNPYLESNYLAKLAVNIRAQNI